MKILIIQLARLGDIYMSWPAMRALRRLNPEAEIHLLTRPRFEGAVEGLNVLDRHWSLSSGDILSPLINDEPSITESLGKLNEFVDDLKAENFDRIINLTFSPASSYLTHALTQLHTEVLGYTRFKDGSLHLADEISSYFYAQVGVGKPNRVHLADIFASMLDIQYEESDWFAPETPELGIPLPERYLVIHSGASEAHKELPLVAWTEVLQSLHLQHPELTSVFIGSDSEKIRNAAIIASVPGVKAINISGQTKIADLFAVIRDAELLIGGDSAPLHMASLTDTPTFNISIGKVNFWETGPKASLSFVQRLDDMSSINGQEIGSNISRLLNGELNPQLIIRASGHVSYERPESVSDRFAWDLVQAIYLSAPYPLADRMEILQGVQQLKDINEFAIEQLRLIPTKGLEFVGPLLDQAEDVIKSIGQWVPELCPLIDWYQAEKVRIGPGDFEAILAAVENVHQRFLHHLQPYIVNESLTPAKEIDGTL